MLLFACIRFRLNLCPQVFVANPHKPKPILDILVRNREKMVEFLSKFRVTNENEPGSDQFNEELAYVIRQIRELKSWDHSSNVPPVLPMKEGPE